MAAANKQTEELRQIFSLFFDGTPASFQIIDTSRGENDFRETAIAETETGEKYVIKLADNDFTFPDKIKMWQRTVEAYQQLGYYCPTIFCDKTGEFPTVPYKGRRCAVYAEAFAPYRSIEDRAAADTSQDDSVSDRYRRYRQDIWKMTARIAEKHLAYTQYPSAYCLFTTFCPSDKTDEVLENAENWKAYAETLPPEFQDQVRRIWRLWEENRKALAQVYDQLPTSVFQADLNATNILIDENGKFVGIYDFNLSGKEVFLNYLMRENFGEFEEEIEEIRDALRIASQYYRFSEAEKEYAPMLYRCLKPLWYNKLLYLKEREQEPSAVKACLDKTEFCLTAPLSFREDME